MTYVTIRPIAKTNAGSPKTSAEPNAPAFASALKPAISSALPSISAGGFAVITADASASPADESPKLKNDRIISGISASFCIRLNLNPGVSARPTKIKVAHQAHIPERTATALDAISRCAYKNWLNSHCE